MNPRLDLLQPYPFERLRALLAGVTPPAGLRPISLGLGEPQHPTPALIKDALTSLPSLSLVTKPQDMFDNSTATSCASTPTRR